MSVTGQYRLSAGPRSVKRLSAGDLVELLAAVAAAGREDMHVLGTPWAGAQAALEEVVLFATAEDPDSSAHADQRCPPTPRNGKSITGNVGVLIAT
jgi:hypothetical protein